MKLCAGDACAGCGDPLVYIAVCRRLSVHSSLSDFGRYFCIWLSWTYLLSWRVKITETSWIQKRCYVCEIYYSVLNQRLCEIKINIYSPYTFNLPKVQA